MITEAETRRMLTSAAEGEFTGAILDVLRAHGRDGQWLKLTEVAQVASISVRSLQRKLSAEGATFSGLVESVRCELAMEALKDRNTTVAETAERLGYFNQGDFARAWKRWSGSTPRQYRDEHSEASIASESSSE